MDHLFGKSTGKVKFEVAGVMDVTFDKSYGEPPQFEEKELEWEDDNGNITWYHFGDRGNIKVYLYNLGASGLANLKILAQMVDVCRHDQVALRVYPKWDDNAVGCAYYECVPPKNWNIQDLTSRAARGQKLELEFKTVSLLSNLPAYSQPEAEQLRVTQNGDIRQTKSGDNRAIN